MKLLAPFIKTIISYDAIEWEIFIREWAVSLKDKYVECKRLGGKDDMGRDVVGFITPAKFDGPWDNYQCKHYTELLKPSVAVVDIAKIIYYSYCGKFTPPRKSWFVAPRGPSTALRDLLGSPAKLREYVQAHWDALCSRSITTKEVIGLDGPLRGYVQDFDFSIFGWYSPDELLDNYRTTAFWAERFGGMLPPPQKGVVPKEIASNESVYVRALLDAYEEQLGRLLKGSDCLAAEDTLLRDLDRQRERFFDAEAFALSYRDQTAPGTIEDFVSQVHFGVEPVVNANHANGYERLCQTLVQATNLTPASILSQQAKPQIKQGVCHQLANNSLIKWVRR